MDPKISIVIPVYNTAEYMEECLLSCINQPFTNIEIICVNDGSTDGSLEILEEFGKKDKRIKIINQRNQGLGAARNNGVKAATGEYIMHLDSDDYLEEECLGKIEALLDVNKPDILSAKAAVKKEGTTINFIPQNFDTVGIVLTGREFLEKSKFYQGIVWNKIWKRSFLNENGLECTEGVYFEDISITINGMLLAKRVISADIVFYNYRIRVNSMSQGRPSKKHIEDNYRQAILFLNQKLKEKGVGNINALRRMMGKRLLSFNRKVIKYKKYDGVKFKYFFRMIFFDLKYLKTLTEVFISSISK